MSFDHEEILAGGKRYRLRPLQPEDLGALAAFSDDYLYWRFLSHGSRSLEQVMAFLEAAISVSGTKDSGERWWAVDETDAGTFVGTTNYKRIGKLEDHNGSVGLSLAPTVQGHGIGSIIGWKMIALAFDCFGLRRVECTCAEGNERSVHIMRDTFGMTYDGMRDIQRESGGDSWRVHVFSLTEAAYISSEFGRSL